MRKGYLSLRKSAAPLLAGLSRDAPELSLCDIAQVDLLWESASLACDQTTELNPAEAYVLGCAFVFHVTAMSLVMSPGRVEELVGGDRWCDLVAHMLSDTSGPWPDTAQQEDPSAEIHEGSYTQTAMSAA